MWVKETLDDFGLQLLGHPTFCVFSTQILDIRKKRETIPVTFHPFFSSIGSISTHKERLIFKSQNLGMVFYGAIISRTYIFPTP
jgi:hypothetical protein